MNKIDLKRNYPMLTGTFKKCGYDWWWHNFTGISEKTGEERTFFIEYFTCNPYYGTDKPILGQLPVNKENHIKPSYLMIKAGWWGKDATQLHNFFPWSNVNLTTSKKGFNLEVCGNICNETTLVGKVEVSEEEQKKHPEYMCDSGKMEWNLQADKKVAFNVGYGASSFFRVIKAFEMYWHAQGMKTEYSGTVIANGEKYIIKKENSFGYADKNWGKNFTSPWVWLSSNDLTSTISGKKLENSVFDIGGGRPKVFFLALNRKLLSDFWYEGKSYEFNFSKFWTLTKTKFDCKETNDKIIWHVQQENIHSAIDVEIECYKDEMLLVNYEDPFGNKRHNRLWNGGTGKGLIKLYKKNKKKLELVDSIQAAHVGCEYGEYD